MKFPVFLFAIFLLFVFPGKSAVTDRVVHISGEAPGYAGEELVFYSWTDQVSFTEREIFSFKVDSNDRFSAEFVIEDDLLYVFANSGRNYLYMYLEPGKRYQVVLPPKTNRSLHESMNPYFEGVPTHLAVVSHDSTELNAIIRSFDNMYEPVFGDPLIMGSAEDIRNRRADQIIEQIDSSFSWVSHPYFDTYRNYKIGLLKNIAGISSARIISDLYFRHEPVKYDNVAYMELFNQVYNRYFLFFSRTVRGSRIFDDINKRRSITSLMNTLETDTVLGRDRLLELVVLKGLHDAFYDSEFSRSGLLVVLDSLAGRSVFPEHVKIASYIRDKVTRLLKGFKPPEFELRNRDGEIQSLSDFKGQYVYLNFCTAASYSCLAEYEMLKRINDEHGDYLRIVTVFIDNSYQSMPAFLKKNDYDWDFLFYGDQPHVLKDYDVRMFPTYYLIDRDGTLLMSPAPSPAEEFESYLMKTMRSRGEFR
ncbi:MAG: TlpA family protein disulfide reductase [Bacteroidales bacterium]